MTSFNLKVIGRVESPLTALEAIDGTSILDVKPLLEEDITLR